MYFRRFMNEVNINKLACAPTVTKQKGRKKYQLLTEFGTGDTEVTTIPMEINGQEFGRGLLYIWSVYLAGYFIYGRTVDEFKEFCLYLYKSLHLSYKRRLVLYIHNLEYDWTFLQAAFKRPEVFATDKRAVLYAYAYGIEFRCSYKLTNMSLDKFTESMDVLHRKQSGDDFDYKKLRTPSTVIGSEDFTVKNMYYIYCDVVGLHEAISTKMERDGDNLATIPMTSTGYVRRETYNAMYKNKKNRKIFTRSALTSETYELCKKAFRGGNTHANRNLAGKILTNVVSYDIASSYPSVIMYEKYPVDAPRLLVVSSVSELIDLILSDLWFITDITLYNVETSEPIPYIAASKCDGYTLKNIKLDNGRILKADKIRLTVLKEDLIIIMNQYQFSGIKVNSCYTSHTDFLPKELRQVTADFFKGKTELKGVEGQEYFYSKLKNLLNALFGMCVQDPVHPIIDYNNGIWSERPTDIDNALNHFYRSYNSFLVYQWGVTITAKARARLQEAIDICGGSIAYVDTDSVKFVYNKTIADKIDAINDRIKAQAVASNIECIAYTRDGAEQIMGLWDNETTKYQGGTYSKFRTYGAKKYAVEYDDRKGHHFEITVAGLNKKKGAKEFGNIDNFVTGVTVTNSGRTRAVYDDEITPHFVEVNGERFKIYTNVAILDTTYTLGVTPEYIEVAPNIIEYAEG